MFRKLVMKMGELRRRLLSILIIREIGNHEELCSEIFTRENSLIGLLPDEALIDIIINVELTDKLLRQILNRTL